MTLVVDGRADALLDRLERILEACLGAQQDVETVLDRERVAAVRMDVRSLETVNAEVEAAAARWNELERARRTTVEALAGHWRVRPDRLALPDLLGLVQEPRRGRLAALRARLKGRAASVSRLQSLNRTLVEESLAYVQDMIRLLTRGGEANPTYDRDGKEARGAAALSLINHLV